VFLSTLGLPVLAAVLGEARAVDLISNRSSARTPAAGPVNTWRPAARYGAAVALALLITVGAFAGLTELAANSKPTDALYFIKRASENIGLAFSFGDEAKAQKNLDLARRRLAELEQLVELGQLKKSDVAYLVDQYRQNEQTAKTVLKKTPDSSAKALSAQMDALAQKEAGIEHKMENAAGAGAMLEPAVGARVTVKDGEGQPTLEASKNSVSGSTDGDGKFEFTFVPRSAADVKRLEAQIELDGRTELVSLAPAAGKGTTADGAYSVSVTPVVYLATPEAREQFIAVLSSDRGLPVARKLLRVRDAAGAGFVNGESGYATVVTDENGNCAFSFLKTSTSKISRVEVEIFEADWRSFGELLSLGPLDRGPARFEDTPALDQGFEVTCEPQLGTLSQGTRTVTVTVKKKYSKLTDYFNQGE
jgi:hypothetical protein